LAPPPAAPFERTAFIDQNLGFVLLAALGEGSTCHCVLAARVQRSSAVFLRMTQRRIESELLWLQHQDLLAASKAESCDRCEESYRLTASGHEFLASCVEEWQLSRLANSAVNT
jgi:DNA-binding PadR family transcriptional regulator